MNPKSLTKDEVASILKRFNQPFIEKGPYSSISVLLAQVINKDKPELIEVYNSVISQAVEELDITLVDSTMRHNKTLMTFKLNEKLIDIYNMVPAFLYAKRLEKLNMRKYLARFIKANIGRIPIADQKLLRTQMAIDGKGTSNTPSVTRSTSSISTSSVDSQTLRDYQHQKSQHTSNPSIIKKSTGTRGSSVTKKSPIPKATIENHKYYQLVDNLYDAILDFVAIGGTKEILATFNPEDTELTQHRDRIQDLLIIIASVEYTTPTAVLDHLSSKADDLLYNVETDERISSILSAEEVTLMFSDIIRWAN